MVNYRNPRCTNKQAFSLAKPLRIHTSCPNITYINPHACMQASKKKKKNQKYVEIENGTRNQNECSHLGCNPLLLILLRHRRSEPGAEQQPERCLQRQGQHIASCSGRGLPSQEGEETKRCRAHPSRQRRGSSGGLAALQASRQDRQVRIYLILFVA